MKRWFVVLALVAIPAVASAQSMDKYVEMLRSDLRAEKTAYLTENMALSDSESTRFWPIQRQYQNELAKLEDQRVALIKEYAANFSKMSDKMATDMVNRAFKLQDQRNALLKQYAGKISKALSPRVAMRFVHCEGAIASMVDLKIRSELPVVE
ncbi:MAG TPA: hypothetical protein VI792_04410 [Candidatus Eisenbacteria bacterium]